MSAEVAEVAGIIATLARAGVTVCVKAGRLVVRGATLDFIPAIETLTGREDAVEKALALSRRARRHGDARSTRSPARSMAPRTGDPAAERESTP